MGWLGLLILAYLIFGRRGCGSRRVGRRGCWDMNQHGGSNIKKKCRRF